MAKTAQQKLDMAEYYLPEGTWTSLLTGEEKEGGKWYREKHGYLSIPLYVKEALLRWAAMENRQYMTMRMA